MSRHHPRIARVTLAACALACAVACAPSPPDPGRNAAAPEPAPRQSPVAPAVDTTQAVPYDLVAADFVDAERGWAAGHDESNNVSTILRTEDGGATWTQLVEVVGDTLTDVDFADASNGWAVGFEGQVYRTADGGATWTSEPAASWVVQRDEPLERVEPEGAPGTVLELSETVVSLFFLDARSGWAAGDSPVEGDLDARRRLLLRTVDGGRTWSELRPSAGADLAFNDLFFVGPAEGWAAAGNVVTREEDALFHTTDGGLSWERVATGTPQYLRAVHFADARTGWVVGLTIDDVTEELGPSRILATTDGGRTWAAQLTVDRSFFDVCFVDASRGWAVGERATIYATTDGGKSWAQQTRFATGGAKTITRPRPAPGAVPPRALSSVSALSAADVWAGGAGIIVRKR